MLSLNGAAIRRILGALDTEFKIALDELRRQKHIMSDRYIPRLQLLSALKVFSNEEGVEEAVLQVNLDILNSLIEIVNISCSLPIQIAAMDFIDNVFSKWKSLVYLPRQIENYVEGWESLLDRRIARHYNSFRMIALFGGFTIPGNDDEQSRIFKDGLNSVYMEFVVNEQGDSNNILLLQKRAKIVARIYRIMGEVDSESAAETNLFKEIQDQDVLRSFIQYGIEHQDELYFGCYTPPVVDVAALRWVKECENECQLRSSFTSPIYVNAFVQCGLLERFLDFLSDTRLTDDVIAFFASFPGFLIMDRIVRRSFVEAALKENPEVWKMRAVVKIIAPQLLGYDISVGEREGCIADDDRRHHRGYHYDERVLTWMERMHWIDVTARRRARQHKLLAEYSSINNSLKTVTKFFLDAADGVQIQKFIEILDSLMHNSSFAKDEDYMLAVTEAGLFGALINAVGDSSKVQTALEVIDIVIGGIFEGPKNFANKITLCRVVSFPVCNERGSSYTFVLDALSSSLLKHCKRSISDNSTLLKPSVLFGLARCCSSCDMSPPCFPPVSNDDCWNSISPYDVAKFVFPCFIAHMRSRDRHIESSRVVFFHLLCHIADHYPDSAVVIEGLIQGISTAISEGDPFLRKLAFEELLKISGSFQQEKLIIAESGILNIIAASLRAENSVDQSLFLRVARNISDGPEMAKEALFRTGIFSFAVSLCANSLDNQDSDFVNGIWIISQMALGNEEQRNRVVESGLIPLFTMCLKSENVVVKGCALRALRDIASGTDEHKDILFKFGIASCIAVILVESRSTSEVLNAVLLTRKLSEGADRHRLALAKSGLMQVLKDCSDNCSIYVRDCISAVIANLAFAHLFVGAE